MAFNFDSFAKLMQNFKVIPSASLKLLNLGQKYPSKKGFSGQILIKSLSSFYKVIMIYLIEMLQLPNFGPMIRYTM